MGCHFLLQGTLLTQGSNPRLLCRLHWWVDSLPLSHLGSLHDYFSQSLFNKLNSNCVHDYEMREEDSEETAFLSGVSHVLISQLSHLSGEQQA